MRKLIDDVDRGEAFDLFKPSLLDAVKLIKSSWNKVEPATIQNCFRKAGFVINDQETEEDTVDTTSGILERLYKEYGINAPVEA